MIDIQLRKCLECGKGFVALGRSRKKFCTQRCRLRFNHRLWRARKVASDPDWAARSLQRLREWKEAYLKSPKKTSGGAHP